MSFPSKNILWNQFLDVYKILVFLSSKFKIFNENYTRDTRLVLLTFPMWSSWSHIHCTANTGLFFFGSKWGILGGILEEVTCFFGGRTQPTKGVRWYWNLRYTFMFIINFRRKSLSFWGENKCGVFPLFPLSWGVWRVRLCSPSLSWHFQSDAESFIQAPVPAFVLQLGFLIGKLGIKFSSESDRALPSLK